MSQIRVGDTGRSKSLCYSALRLVAAIAYAT